MAFNSLPQTVQNTLGKVKSTVQDNPLATIGVATGIASVVAVGGVVVAGTVRRASTTRRRKTTTKRRGKLTARQRQVRKIKRRPGRQSPYTAGARKDRSRTRVRYTKNGQPYTLSGKGGRAKFISKRSAKARRR